MPKMKIPENIKSGTFRVKTIVTSARRHPHNTSFAGMKQDMQNGETYLLVFGTGWGLSPEFVEKADYILDPICGPTDYNHLSVRAAAAVVLDRLMGSGS